ncbi:MAG: ATP-binding protein [Flavobacteriales bacterium]|nr:ATP-binding protein [Flavobacteriales bacterium]
MNKPTLTHEQKQAIGAKLMEAYEKSGFSSRAKYAVSIGINSSDFSNIASEKWASNDRLLSHSKWLRIARSVGFEFTPAEKWVTARTETYLTISKQLEVCQAESLAAMFCDRAGIGKTHVCKEFAATHRNAFYINGGLAPNRFRFIRALAQAAGIEAKGSAEDVLADFTYYLKSLERPILIIDEAGDMDNSTYRLLKRLYNELEFVCGFYMVGAPDLRKRIENSIRLKRNSFEEVYSRFGGRYLHVVPQEPHAQRKFIQQQVMQVCRANGLTDPERLEAVVTRSLEDMGRGLRYARIQVKKSRIAA